jgi:hypothetical protein
MNTIRRVKETGALDMLAAELDEGTTTMEYATISITSSGEISREIL